MSSPKRATRLAPPASRRRKTASSRSNSQNAGGGSGNPHARPKSFERTDWPNAGGESGPPLHKRCEAALLARDHAAQKSPRSESPVPANTAFCEAPRRTRLVFGFFDDSSWRFPEPSWRSPRESVEVGSSHFSLLSDPARAGDWPRWAQDAAPASSDPELSRPAVQRPLALSRPAPHEALPLRRRKQQHFGEKPQYARFDPLPDAAVVRAIGIHLERVRDAALGQLVRKQLRRGSDV